MRGIAPNRLRASSALRVSWRPATLVCLLAAAPAAHAQGPATADPLGEAALFQEVPTVTAASRYEQDPREAPASTSVVTQEEIRRYGYRTLAEALSGVRGFFTTYDRNYSYLAVRGFTLPGDYNTRILLLVDGHRLNDNVADAAYVGSEAALDLSTVERIEVVRGAASEPLRHQCVLRGRERRDSQRPLVAGRRGQGRRGHLRLVSRAMPLYGRRQPSGLEFVASGGFYRSAGPDLYFPEFDTPATNNGLASGLDGDRTGDGFAKVTYKGWTVEGGVQGRRKQVPTASFETTFDDPRLQTWDRHAFAFTRYDHPFTDLSRINVTLAYDRYRYEGRYPYGSVVQQDVQSGDWWTLDLQYVRPVGSRNKLVVGGEYRLNTRQDQALFDEDPFVSYLDDRRDSKVWALFAQNELRISSKLLLNAGVRHDAYESFGGTTNPRAALIYNLDQSTTLKALYGRAFRAPNLYELYSQDGGLTQKPNPTLRPETIESYELMAERQLTRELRAAVSVYHFDASRLIRLTTDPADSLLVFRNQSRARSTGLELETEATFGAISAHASYALQRVRDAESNAAPVNSPTHLGRLAVSAPFLKERVRASAEARFVSARRTVAGASAPGYGIANLTLLAQPLSRGLELSGTVYNLFDHAYGDPGGEELAQDIVMQDGRVFRVGVRYQF